MARKDPPPPAAAEPPRPAGLPTLDDLVVALQKAFSRVSTRSAGLSEDAARALVVGKVNFDLALKTRLEQDVLLVDSGGPIELRLAGAIEQDIREAPPPPYPTAGTAERPLGSPHG